MAFFVYCSLYLRVLIKNNYTLRYYLLINFFRSDNQESKIEGLIKKLSHLSNSNKGSNPKNNKNNKNYKKIIIIIFLIFIFIILYFLYFIINNDLSCIDYFNILLENLKSQLEDSCTNLGDTNSIKDLDSTDHLKNNKTKDNNIFNIFLDLIKTVILNGITNLSLFFNNKYLYFFNSDDLDYKDTISNLPEKNEELESENIFFNKGSVSDSDSDSDSSSSNDKTT